MISAQPRGHDAAPPPQQAYYSFRDFLTPDERHGFLHVWPMAERIATLERYHAKVGPLLPPPRDPPPAKSARATAVLRRRRGSEAAAAEVAAAMASAAAAEVAEAAEAAPSSTDHDESARGVAGVVGVAGVAGKNAGDGGGAGRNGCLAPSLPKEDLDGGTTCTRAILPAPVSSFPVPPNEAHWDESLLLLLARPCLSGFGASGTSREEKVQRRRRGRVNRTNIVGVGLSVSMSNIDVPRHVSQGPRTISRCSCPCATRRLATLRRSATRTWSKRARVGSGAKRRPRVWRRNSTRARFSSTGPTPRSRN